MFHYLAEEGLSDEQWMLRKRVLDLHDCVNRHRSLKVGYSEDRSEQSASIMEELKDRIRSNEAFERLDSKKQEKLLSGHEKYVDGLRSAARTAGWNIEEFNAVYSYFSAHSHTDPMSFYRMDDNALDFLIPSDFQYDISTYALKMVKRTFEGAIERFRDLFPNEAGSPLSSSHL
jgi:hypothetical protein